MALVERRKDVKGITYGIWEIREPISYFEDRLDLNHEESSQVSLLKGRRKLEWLASRWLLHVITGRQERIDISKDAYGKPFLMGQDSYISISHTHGYTSAIVGDKPVGIDIQVRVDKIHRIAKKFLSHEELDNINPKRSLDFLHIYWGAKECLYKAYGRKRLDFRTHLAISPFNLEQGLTMGSILKDRPGMTFDIYFHCLEAYILVYSVKR